MSSTFGSSYHFQLDHIFQLFSFPYPPCIVFLPLFLADGMRSGMGAAFELSGLHVGF